VTYPCFGPIEVKLRIEWRVDADVVEGAGGEAKGGTVIVLEAIPLHSHRGTAKQKERRGLRGTGKRREGR
jgi:hypothetical protein